MYEHDYRLEAFKLRSIPGVLKIASILLSIGGTMLISLYKGKSLHLWDSIIQHQNEHKSATNQLRGTILLVGSSFTFACWFLIQVIINIASNKVYIFRVIFTSLRRYFLV